MHRTWLVLDVNYLATRDFYTLGHLEHDSNPTGIVYGVLRDVLSLQERFGTAHFVFCFDYGKGLREQRYPTYKRSRRIKLANNNDIMQRRQLGNLRSQIGQLRDDHLYDLGYQNVFFQPGYEADDVIASIVAHKDMDDKIVMVSEDRDLFQLLKPGVLLYLPRNQKIVTDKSFQEDYGIRPVDWIWVKAIGGCTSDDIKGVTGVGEIRACKYLRKELPKVSKPYRDIIAFVETDQFWENVNLVELPYPGIQAFQAKAHPEVTEDAWKALTERLGITTLAYDGRR